ncbi:PAS domain S-box protein [Chitinophaga polysaccharea]|uniref:PAS domain S-box protein n=1 Tax=Chitinophaga polysaccharea TaxID=1293035 RepID=UPI001454ED64|nr:PAS domain S-box protein [Chitinophaga polysaccharea]NLR57607.1 PAS domain S-box protein [Chitinophaga polysaccharea]
MINAPLTATLREETAAYGFLSGGGETGELIRSFNWDASALGPVNQWPSCLKTCIRILLTSPQPMFLWWGREGIHLYNDACKALLGDKHPAAMGQPAAIAWSRLWEQLQPRFSSLMNDETVVAGTPLLQIVQQEGIYYHFSGSPIPDETGHIAGVMAIGAIADNSHPLLAYTKTDVSGFTRDLLHHFDDIIAQTGLTLVVNFDPVTPEIYIDRDMWEKVLFILLTNALRYTLQGGVAVRLSQEEGTLQLTVSDSGVGISHAMQTAIGERCLHSDAPKTGLALVDELVKRDGGAFEISSTVGEGSVFRITFPVGKEHLPADKVINGDAAIVYKLYPDFTPHQIAATRKLKQEVDDQRYRRLLECLPAAIYTCDKEGRLLFFNEAAVQLWGRTPQPGIDKWCGAWKIYQLDGTTPIRFDAIPMAQTIKSGRPVRGQQMIVERPDGRRRIVQPYPDPLFDANGQLVGAVNMLVDVTDQRANEEYISRMAAIVEYSDDAIIGKTLEGIVTSWNPAAERLFGYTAEEMIGTSITRIIPPDKLMEEPIILQQLRDGQRIDHFETKRVTKDGTLLDISLTISPVKDLQGNIIGASKIARDVTDQRELFSALKESESKYMQLAFKLEAMVEQRTNELVEANFYLRKSNQELEQFAYITSHDLQEPLRKIQTFAGMLYNNSKDVLSETSRIYIDKVMLSAKRMSQLISELLDYSRLIHVKDPFVETDLNDILVKVLNDFEVLIGQRDVQISIGNLPCLMASPLQMNQLFHNLLGNAIKFSSPNRKPVIEIYAERLGAADIAALPELDAGREYHAIVVKDNGIGFDQIYSDKIFQIFQRLNDRTAFEGTGIGLALCSKIAINHKGIIYATGVPDEGACFRVVLPA